MLFGLLAACLFFLDLVQALAVDTLCGSRACFHTAQADLYTAGFTVTVFAVADQCQGVVNFLDQFAFAVTCTKFEA